MFYIILYNPSNQKVQINVGYLSNPLKPKFTPKILSTPYATWSNGQAVSLTGVWEGIGTSYLSCTINPFGHSGDTLTIGYWIDFSNPEIMQLDDWSYIELPFGSGTVDEIIKAMQRDGNWLRQNKSKMSWTQSTTYLNKYNYIIFRNSSGEHQSTYQIVNYNGFLQIKTSIDFDFRIRIGGIPENCYANTIFGWNPLGELGDRVKSPKGPYYTYTYSLDAFVTKDVHPSVRSIFPTYHEAKINRYKEVYSEAREVFYSEGIPLKDSYSWNICGYAPLKQSTVVDYYLDVIERMFAALCPIRKGGDLPPSGEVIVVKIPPKVVTPIGKGGTPAVPNGGTIIVPRKGIIIPLEPIVIVPISTIKIPGTTGTITIPGGKEIPLEPLIPVTIVDGGEVIVKIPPITDGGDIGIEKKATPITFPKGGTVTPPKEVTVNTITTIEPPINTYEDFIYLLEQEFPEFPNLSNFIETGIPSDQDVLNYDLPWYSVEETLTTIAEQIKSEIIDINPDCEEIGSVSEPKCSPCSPPISSTKGSIELLDLACSIIDGDIDEPEKPEPLDPPTFYSPNPFILDPLTSIYTPITSVDYNPEIPELTIKYDIISPNELITTVTPIEDPEIFLDKEFNNNIRIPEIKENLPELSELFPEIVDILPELINTFPEVVTKLPELSEKFPEIKEVLTELVNTIPITDILPKLVEKFPEIKEVLPEILPLTDILPKLVEKFPEINEVLPELIETLPENEILPKLVELFPEIKEVLPELIETLPVIELLSNLVDKFPGRNDIPQELIGLLPLITILPKLVERFPEIISIIDKQPLDELITTIPLEETQVIMGIDINDDFLNPSRKFILDYANEEIVFYLKNTISNKYTIKSSSLIDCYPLSGINGRKYVFYSSYHGIIEIPLPLDKIQITPLLFIELLKKYLSPFVINYKNNIITVDSGNNSIKVLMTPIPDPFSLQTVTLYENKLELVKVGTNLKVGELIVKEKAVPAKIILFYSYMKNSSLPDSSVYISG